MRNLLRFCQLRELGVETHEDLGGSKAEIAVRFNPITPTSMTNCFLSFDEQFPNAQRTLKALSHCNFKLCMFFFDFNCYLVEVGDFFHRNSLTRNKLTGKVASFGVENTSVFFGLFS